MLIYFYYLITYIPIVVSLVGGFILSNQLLIHWQISPRPIYIVFVLSSICSVYAFSITKYHNLLHSENSKLRHILNEKIVFVNLTLISLILLGVASAIGLYLINKNYHKEISMAIIISIIALFSSIFSIRSEYIKSNWYFYSKQIK